MQGTPEAVRCGLPNVLILTPHLRMNVSQEVSRAGRGIRTVASTSGGPPPPSPVWAFPALRL